MNLPHDTLPDKPLKRFLFGFGAVGVVTFVVVLLHGDSLKRAIMEASVAAVVLGLFAGMLSAFGKKLLRYVLTLAEEIIANP